MLKTILGQNVFVYIMTALGIVGVVSRFILNGYLKGLIKEAEKMGSTRKRALVEIRKRYEDVASLNVEINDTVSFVGKYIEKMKMGKISVNAFDNFIKNIFIITAGTGILSGIYQYYVLGSGMETLKLLGVAAAACALMLISWNLWDCRNKKNVLRFSVQNYLSNSLANRLHKEEMKQAAASDMSRDKMEQIEIYTEKEEKGADDKNKCEVTDEQVAACDMLFEKLLQGIISDA